MPYHVCRCGFTWQSFRELFESVRTAMAGPRIRGWLVEHGYAMVMTIPPNVKHQELFLKLQREAREAKRGLWR